MLETKNISVEAGSATLLSDVSVLLNPGELVAVVGPNGAGKSTLLKALSGEHKVSRGEVCLENKLLSDWPRQLLAKKRAVLPQQSSLEFPFSVRDVVLMGRSPHLEGGAETVIDQHIVRDALTATEVVHLEDRIYTTLSGGERQRVQLARVLAQIWNSIEPSYLLLDEPVSALDLAHQHSILKLVQEVAKNRVGVVVVLHDLNLALRYCDDVWVLRDASLVAAGKVNLTLTEELIDEIFDIQVKILSQKESAGRQIIVVD